ncbi:hypothetical protein PV327_003360 [Microctonus hyperodae]|uniref:Uncharacterized protein n=1 Tax=Microctonus hyperodae TaxID=165561 RepID=A0AA39G5G2_MICHY|nr:hypothetical protein PV327_003360 [Microctonus hyperodae]
MCHFCNKRVYLMERLTTEGKFFHRGCFRCEYCSTSLRIGNHTFDREKNGGRFYCTQHFGLLGTMKTRQEKKKIPLLNKENIPDTSAKKKSTAEKTQTLKPPLDGVAGLDLLDRGQTPERIEFENLAGMSDAEEAHSQMDEDEWTDRNFGASAAEMGSSDDISDMSDSDEVEIYEEAIDQPLTTEGTIELAKNWTLRYSHGHASGNQSDTGSNEYEDSSDEYTSEDEESGTATEDEDDVRARELRKQEVWLKVPSRESDTETGSETEVASDDESSGERQENSATEISTDSEFEHDGLTPTQQIPEISINDAFVRKTRGHYVEPKKVQVKSRIISPVNGNLKQNTEEPVARITLRKIGTTKLNDSPRPSSVNPMPLINPRRGDYLLNRTHSTEGIASKVSLELKKRFLLGGSVLGGSVIKSGSTSNVDTKLRNFTDSISQHQKLLNPAPEPSPTMQAFLQGTNKLRSTTNIPLSPILSTDFLHYNRNINKLQEIGKPKLINDYTKIHLPDLIKETNIMKSKTDPNILRTGSLKVDGNPMENNEEKVEEIKLNDAECKVIPDRRDERRVIETNKINEICQPESSLYEKPIISSQTNWDKASQKSEQNINVDSGNSDMDSDSLSSTDQEVNEEINDEKSHENISATQLKINSVDENFIHDKSAERFKVDRQDTGVTFEPDSIECVLNVKEDEIKMKATKQQSSTSPTDLWSRSSNDNKKCNAIDIQTVNNNLKRLDLKDTTRLSFSNCSSPTSVASTVSNRHDDSAENDLTNAVLTETELSEWAHDGEGFVSVDLRDVEFDTSSRGYSTPKKIKRGNARMAKEEDLTDIELLSDIIYDKIDRKVELPTDTSKLLVNGEDIDYMDTDNESLLDSLRDATNIPLVKNRGYVEFVNVPGILSTSVSRDSNSRFSDAPIAHSEIEPELCSDDEKYDENVIEINPVTMDDIKDRLNNSETISSNQNEKIDRGGGNNNEVQVIEAVNREIIQSMDEDSLVVIEPTEDTTTSELTTILASPLDCLQADQSDVNTKVNEEPSSTLESTDANHPDYVEYVKRLQSRIAEFSNAKDSIDVRKSKRKNSKSTIQINRSSEMICEEIKMKDSINPSFNSPATSRKLEEITRERSKQKTLIQDILMDKIEAHKQKSAEKKAKRLARTASFNANTQLFPTKPIVPLDSSNTQRQMSPLTFSPINSPMRMTFGEAKKSLDSSPLITTNEKRNSPTNKISDNSNINFNKKSLQNINSESREIYTQSSDEFKTPIAPPRLKHEEARRTAEKAKQEARERARLMSDEDLGLSPEDKIKLLRMKVARRQLSMEDRSRKYDDDVTPNYKTRHYSFTFNQKSNTTTLQPSKSTDNMKAFAKRMTLDLSPPSTAKSMGELAHMNKESNVKSVDTVVKRDKKKAKDPERRKSIIQAVSDFFKRKDTSPSPTSHKDKGSVFKLTTPTKKSMLDKIDRKSDGRPQSVCEGMLTENYRLENSPPVPPPPMNYRATMVHITDDSMSDDDSKTAALSLSHMHKNILIDGSCSSLTKKMRNTKRLARQAQAKRLRMAQEIQRKLEETEVKQRDLESRGVSVEKALRGEGECTGREETDLLGEWFDLMRERTDLRRYEKELLVRAQEVQLEDRHERLQQELRERLADDDQKKTSADVKKEGEILTEMLEIAAKRDSLNALLEEERQRFKNEDKELQTQMLVKGLGLTQINQDDTKYSV